MIGMRAVRTVTRYFAHKLPNAGGAKRHARIINEVIQFRKFLLIGFISHAAPLSQDLHNQTSDQSFGSDGGGDQSIGPLTPSGARRTFWSSHDQISVAWSPFGKGRVDVTIHTPI
jgi:hypothetical protein